MSYGLGWRIGDYRGHRLLEHGGAADGLRSYILLLPKERLGLVLLLNLAETNVSAATATAYTLLDHLLGLPPLGWHEAYRERQRQLDEAARSEAEALAKSRKPDTHPSRPPEAFAGVYEDAAYGVLKVTKDGAGLRLAWSSLAGPLEHWHYDVYRLTGTPAANGELVQFLLRPDGEVESLRFLGRTFARKKDAPR
jgi:hypothetical protein